MKFTVVFLSLLVHECAICKDVHSSPVQVKTKEVLKICDTSQSQVLNNTALEQRLRKLEKIVDDLNTAIEEQNNTITVLQERLVKETPFYPDHKYNSSFLAVERQNQAVAPNAVVKYSHIVHSAAPKNFGYDEKISFYRCPYDGTYVFFTNIVTASSSVHYNFAIKKEGTILSSSYSYSNGDHESMSIMAVTPCLRGEDVWVENIYSSAATTYSTADGRTHFTGFRLY